MKLRGVVAAMLYNDAGQVLLQQRDNKPGIPFPNCWTLFGGSVEEGETPDAAVRREMLEELELELPLTFWMAYVCPVRTIPGEVTTTNTVFAGRMTRPIETLTLHEGQGMAYFDRDSAAQLDLAFQQTPVLLAFFDALVNGEID